MIYGYYCIYPERVGEHYKVSSRRERVDRLTRLNAPEIILVNERRVLDELISAQSDIDWFRDRLKKLYEEGNQRDVLDNYQTVLEDGGFDAATAYSGKTSGFDGDYLKPIETLTDNEVRSFLTYIQGKFNAYHEKYMPKLYEIRDLFISRIKQCVENGKYPTCVLSNLERLKQASIEIDDGFTTNVEGSAGWFNAHRNVIVLSARTFDGKNIDTLFHECFHGIAGVSDSRDGFNRLAEFFGDDYEDAYTLLNEAFTNAQSIGIMTSSPPQWLRDEQTRDAKIESIIRRTGTQEIPQDVFESAYFSDNMDDVKALADAVSTAFSPAELWSDLTAIKDKNPPMHSVAITSGM